MGSFLRINNKTKLSKEWGLDSLPKQRSSLKLEVHNDTVSILFYYVHRPSDGT